MGSINTVQPLSANTISPGSSDTDTLNDLGVAVLQLDTRWVILAALVFVGAFLVILKLKKQRWMSRDQIASLSLALLQLYSVPVIFCMLVLTDPPRFDLVSSFQRQGVGLLAFIFLVVGVFMQIYNIWK